VSDEQERLEHALALAYRYLNPRERTSAEVRRHLERNGVDTVSRDEAVELLAEQGYVDDARFAQLFVQDKRELGEWGSERIRHGLLARGIDRELILDALVDREAVEETTELERALTLLSRRFPSPPHERRERDRALGLLIRKGYDPELALEALTAYATAGD
jgi:regulatory protein